MLKHLVLATFRPHSAFDVSHWRTDLFAAGLASKVDRWFFLLSLATLPHSPRFHFNSGGNSMNSIVYIVGLVVIIGAILAFLGLR